MSDQQTTPASPYAALQWAIIARQRELAHGAGSVAMETLESDPIWLALAKLAKEHAPYG